MDDTGTGISPELVAALARQGQQRQLLEGQLQLGRSMLMHPAAQGYGALGGIGAGLSNAAHGIVGGMLAGNARRDLVTTAEQNAKLRGALVSGLSGATPTTAQDVSVPPMTSGGDHPIPTPIPIQEPGGATASASQPAPSHYLTGGVDPTAMQQKAMMLMASGDPALEQAGGAMLQQARAQRQMDFEADQNAKNRSNATDIANRHQFHVNGMMGGGFDFDPASGSVRTIAGPTQNAGGGLNPYPVGSKPFEQVENIAKDLEGKVDIAHIPSNLQQDVLRLQLGQNLQGALQQAQASGWSKPMRQMVAGELEKMVNGVAGSEGALESLSAKSGVGGAFSDIKNAITGDISGPDLAKYAQFVSDFASREHGLAQDRLGSYLDGQLAGGQGSMLKQLSPERYKAVRDAALQKLAGLGEIKQPSAGGQKTERAPANLDGPTHYLVSPDGKTRIPADASGKPLPNAKPEPVNG